MNIGFDPAARARWVLETMGISDAPASHLDEIAAAQKIKVGRQSLPDDINFSGALLFRGDRKAILLNTFIPNVGRINFTFAHELGHHFLQHKPDFQQDGQSGFRCSPKDMDDSYRPQEVAANRFAAELLMPAAQFQPMMIGAPLDYTLINHLARHFEVSKRACGNRLLEFTQTACIIIYSSGFTIAGKSESSAAKRRLLPMSQIPFETAAHDAIAEQKNQIEFSEVDPKKWLVKTSGVMRLYECTRGNWQNNVATTILKW